MMKKVVAIVLAGLLSLTASAAMADGPLDTSKVSKDLTAKAAGKKLQIATVVSPYGVAWFDRMQEGIKQFAADTGHEAWETGPTQADAAQQVQIVESLIAQGVDAICIIPSSVDALEPVLKKARDQGIVVISHEASSLKNTDFDIEAVDNKVFGEQMMDHLGKAMNGEGKYVVTVGSLTWKSQNEWADAAIAYQKAHFPQMQEATGRIETNANADMDYTKVQEILSTYPDLKGVLGTAMPASVGIGRLVAERGLQGKLLFAGTGLMSVAGKYLTDGDIQYIQFWDPAAAGYAMNILATMAVEKKQNEIKAGLDLGLPGYSDLTTPNPARPNLLYGSGQIGLTKNDDISKYHY
jgi:simple sugar transport system substrate-binding protein